MNAYSLVAFTGSLDPGLVKDHSGPSVCLSPHAPTLTVERTDLFVKTSDTYFARPQHAEGDQASGLKGPHAERHPSWYDWGS